MLTSVENVIFNGVDLSAELTDSDYAYFIVNSVRGRGVMSESLEMVDVASVDGTYLTGSKTTNRVLEVDITIKGESHTDLRRRVERLSKILRSGGNEPVPVQFDDEPGRTYYGHLAGVTHRVEVSHIYQATLTLICPDPYKYGPEKSAPITSSPVTVNGTAPTYPVATITLKAPTAYIAFSDGDNLNLIGNPVSVDDTPKERLTRRYWSQANSLVGWTTPGAVEGGAITGTMATDGFKFYASDYGAGTGWHGPARKVGLPEVLTDFQVDALVELANASNHWGKIIISGLDQANNVVFSMSMGDAYSTPQALGQVRAGSLGLGHNIISHIGNPPAWNDFKGMLRVGRNKKTWYALIARYDMQSDKYSARMYKEWIDHENKFVGKIAQIQVQIVSYGTRTPAVAKLEDIKVYRINDLSANEIPFIGDAGDVFVLDHEHDAVYRNGELINHEIAFISKYFPLKSGLNYLTVEPAEAIESADVRWRDRWL